MIQGLIGLLIAATAAVTVEDDLRGRYSKGIKGY